MALKAMAARTISENLAIMIYREDKKVVERCEVGTSWSGEEDLGRLK